MLSFSPLHHGNPRRAYDALSVTALIGLVTLTFDLFTDYSRDGLPSTLPILGFLGLSVVELGRGTRQTDIQTPAIIS